MKIISFIDDQQLVKKILKHLGLWDVKRKPLPRTNGPPVETFIIYDELPAPSADDPPSLMMLRRDTLPDPRRTARLTCLGVVRRTKTETYL